MRERGVGTPPLNLCKRSLTVQAGVVGQTRSGAFAGSRRARPSSSQRVANA